MIYEYYVKDQQVMMHKINKAHCFPGSVYLSNCYH